MPKALITGVTGQDGSYLAEFLLHKGYEVTGMVRRSSTVNYERIAHIQGSIEFVNGDLLDQISLIDAIKLHEPDEIYNLAAQSFVQTSFGQPVLTGETTALSVTRILDAIRIVNPSIRFYQASSSEMFGKVAEVPQSEKTPFYPRSPYGVAKVYGHWITVNYRESYDLHASSGILFNHESPRRGLEFVTRKISYGAASIKLGMEKKLPLGNLDAKRDWGHAKDYVQAMWKMLQKKTPSDYVIATGKQYTVKQFVNFVLKELNMKFNWTGKGIKSKCYYKKKCIIQCDKSHYRPLEVDTLLGDASKAKRELNWKPKINIKQLIREMIQTEIEILKHEGY